MMEPSVISAIAAFAGAAAGGTGSFLGPGSVNSVKSVSNGVTQDKLRRQSLYREFIEEASKCYADALQHHQPDILVLVVLYAKTSEMRVISSPDVLAAAEDAVRRLIDTYSGTNINFTDIELKTLIQDGSFDLLRDFSESCRAEFDRLRAQRF